MVVTHQNSTTYCVLKGEIGPVCVDRKKEIIDKQKKLSLNVVG